MIEVQHFIKLYRVVFFWDVTCNVLLAPVSSAALEATAVVVKSTVISLEIKEPRGATFRNPQNPNS